MYGHPETAFPLLLKSSIGGMPLEQIRTWWSRMSVPHPKRHHQGHCSAAIRYEINLARSPRHGIPIAAEIKHWVHAIIVGNRSGDVGQVLWALHTPEIYPRIVRLATLDEPSVPIVAPLAT